MLCDENFHRESNWWLSVLDYPCHWKQLFHQYWQGTRGSDTRQPSLAASPGAQYKIAVLSYKVLHDTTPETTHSCCWHTWSTSTPLCQHRSPGSILFQTFHHRWPSFSGCRLTDLELITRHSRFGINTAVIPAPIEISASEATALRRRRRHRVVVEDRSVAPVWPYGTIQTWLLLLFQRSFIY